MRISNHTDTGICLWGSLQGEGTSQGSRAATDALEQWIRPQHRVDSLTALESFLSSAAPSIGSQSTLFIGLQVSGFYVEFMEVMGVVEIMEIVVLPSLVTTGNRLRYSTRSYLLGFYFWLFKFDWHILFGCSSLPSAQVWTPLTSIRPDFKT